MNEKKYVLPALPFGYGELSPVISREQLSIHHEKHHSAYVNGANAILEKIAVARSAGSHLDMKSEMKALSFNIGGHILHSMFWGNLLPVKDGGGSVGAVISGEISAVFGSFERFKEEFAAAALSVEGSGWAALVRVRETGDLMVWPIEKHNVLIVPDIDILLVLDVFEHAYYLDYRNERAKFIDAFWQIINWGEVERRFEESSR